MSNAKYDPNLVKAMWGPIILIGFESGAFITATMNAVERYTRKAAFNRSIHTQVTDNGGSVTMRFQADSPSILPLQTALKTDLAPGGIVTRCMLSPLAPTVCPEMPTKYGSRWRVRTSRSGRIARTSCISTASSGSGLGPD